MKIYKSYGVLAHEKQPIYTVDRPASEIYDIVDVAIPEGWGICEGVYGDKLICSPDGVTYLAGEIITNWGDDPALVWCDNRQERHRVMLKEAEK